MKIHLEGLVWQVELADAHSPELTVDNAPCRGATWYGQQRIYISNELSPECALRVIRHEVTHAYIWGTQLSRPQTYDEEYICDFFAMWAPQILDASTAIYKVLYPEASSREQ